MKMMSELQLLKNSIVRLCKQFLLNIEKMKIENKILLEYVLL